MNPFAATGPLAADTADVLAYLRGECHPLRCSGFETIDEAERATHVLEAVRRYEETEEGPFVLGVLRSFAMISTGTDGTGSELVSNRFQNSSKGTVRLAREQRGLASLYVWLCSLDDEPCLAADVLAKRFAEGEEKEAKYKAAETYATCVLRLDAWLTGVDHDAGRYR